MPTAEKRSAPFHYGWIILATAVGTSFASVTFFNPVLGAFTSSLETEFGWSRAEVPLAIALGSLVGGIVSPLSGALIDKWGARWIIFIAGVGMLLARVDTNPILKLLSPQFLPGRLCVPRAMKG